MNKSGNFGMACHQAASFSPLLMRCDRAEAVFWPGCALMNLDPEILLKAAEILRRTEPALGLCACCCGQPTAYLFPKKHGARRHRIEAMLRKNGVRRIYTACPNCAVQLSSLSGIEVIPIWSALQGVLTREDVIGCDMPLMLHDPCPTKNDAEQQRAVRGLLELCGAELHEPENSGADTICCGNFHMLRATDPEKSAAMRKRRVEQLGRDLAVTSCCEGCLNAFRSEGLETVHVLEALFGRSKARGWGNRAAFTKQVGRKQQ